MHKKIKFEVQMEISRDTANSTFCQCNLKKKKIILIFHIWSSSYHTRFITRVLNLKLVWYASWIHYLTTYTCGLTGHSFDEKEILLIVRSWYFPQIKNFYQCRNNITVFKTSPSTHSLTYSNHMQEESTCEVLNFWKTLFKTNRTLSSKEEKGEVKKTKMPRR